MSHSVETNPNCCPGFGLPLNFQPDGKTDPQGIGLQPEDKLFPNALDIMDLDGYEAWYVQS
jgi:hypothetical protein